MKAGAAAPVSDRTLNMFYGAQVQLSLGIFDALTFASGAPPAPIELLSAACAAFVGFVHLWARHCLTEVVEQLFARASDASARLVANGEVYVVALQVWDPVLIISQITAIQCLFYISLGVLEWLIIGERLRVVPSSLPVSWSFSSRGLRSSCVL